MLDNLQHLQGSALFKAVSYQTVKNTPYVRNARRGRMCASLRALSGAWRGIFSGPYNFSKATHKALMLALS